MSDNSNSKHFMNAVPNEGANQASETMNETIDLAAVRARLAKDGGKRFWQSLEELAETPGYRYKLENEFAENSKKEAEGFDRRGMLKLMAASAAISPVRKVSDDRCPSPTARRLRMNRSASSGTSA